MLSEAFSIAQRIVILVVSVVLIGFGAMQMMHDRSRQGALPHLINLHGISSPAFPETSYNSTASAPETWIASESVASTVQAEVRAQPRLDKVESAPREQPSVERIAPARRSVSQMDLEDLLQP